MMQNRFVISVLAVVALLLAVALAIQLMPKGISLPSSAVKLSECVPNMGAKIALTRLGKIEVLNSYDEQRIENFIKA